MDKGETRLDQLVLQYRAFNRSEGKTIATVAWYDLTLDLFLGFLDSGGYSTLLKDLSIQVVRQYIVYLQERPSHPNQPNFNKGVVRRLSPTTVENYVRSLRAFFNWLHIEGYTEEHVLQQLKPPRVPRKVIEPLTYEELSLIMSAINPDSDLGARDAAIVITLLDTGLRISELASLKTDDAHLEQGYLKVFGKGQKERIVPIGSATQKTLMRYVFHFRPESLNHTVTNFLLKVDGSPMTAHSLKMLMRRLAERSGVKRLHAHLLRHTFAVNYLMNGADVFSLQQILGHTTLEMVRRYVNLSNTQVISQHRLYSPVDRMGLRQVRRATKMAARRGTNSNRNPGQSLGMDQRQNQTNKVRSWQR